MTAVPSIVTAVAAIAVVLIAYLAGRNAGKRETIPWRPIFQLVEHRTRCLGRDPAAVRAEIAEILEIPSWACAELFRARRPLDRSRRSMQPGVPA